MNRKLHKEELTNPLPYSIVWAMVWQNMDNGVYILSVKESKASHIHPVDLYFKSPGSCKAAFRRYWGKNIPEKPVWKKVD